ncbi:hypothetical protein N9K77_01165 [bacterium]|nr:hypothetical protein [bacterium]
MLGDISIDNFEISEALALDVACSLNRIVDRHIHRDSSRYFYKDRMVVLSICRILELDHNGNFKTFDFEAQCHSVFQNVKTILDESVLQQVVN